MSALSQENLFVNPPQRILAVTDLSAPALQAVERAASLAKTLGTAFELLHVFHTTPLKQLRQLMMESAAEMEHKMLEAARQKLDELAAMLHERYQIPVDTRLVAGALLQELVAEANRLPDSLVVCSVRGERFMRQQLLGSTAERLLNLSTNPVLATKQVPHEPYRSVLVAVDFSETSVPTIRCAQAIAPDAALTLMHVIEVPFERQLYYASVGEALIKRYRSLSRQEAMRRLESLVIKAGLERNAVQLVVSTGDPSMRILEQEQEHQCDLLTLGRHGDNAIETLLLGSVVRPVLSKSQCDVLISV